MNINKEDFRKFLDSKPLIKPGPKLFICTRCYRPYEADNISLLCWICEKTEREDALSEANTTLLGKVEGLERENTTLGTGLRQSNDRIKQLEENKHAKRPTDSRTA